MKKIQFSSGFQQINEIVLLTLVPEGAVDGPVRPDESADPPERVSSLLLDPADPNTYETSVHWPDRRCRSTSSSSSTRSWPR